MNAPRYELGIQTKRDNFGAHTDERTDTKGVLHTQWEKE
jgi:6-phosphogluconate dehydrogenase